MAWKNFMICTITGFIKLNYCTGHTFSQYLPEIQFESGMLYFSGNPHDRRLDYYCSSSFLLCSTHMTTPHPVLDYPSPHPKKKKNLQVYFTLPSSLLKHYTFLPVMSYLYLWLLSFSLIAVHRYAQLDHTSRMHLKLDEAIWSNYLQWNGLNLICA